MAASSDSMWSDLEAEYLFEFEQSAEKHEARMAMQNELRKEVPEWLHQQLTQLASKSGKELTYWKKHGRFRAYIGRQWCDVRAEIEKARGWDL